MSAPLLPAGDELRNSEATSMGLLRGLGVEPESWERLLAIAQQEVGRYQQRWTLDEASKLYNEDTASPLIAAARIIYAVAVQREKESVVGAQEYGLDVPGGFDQVESFDEVPPREEDEGALLLILACAAFAMYGNFPSAAAVQRMLSPTRLWTEGQWLAISISNPRRLGEALRSNILGEDARAFLERLNQFLFTGDVSESGRLISDFEQLMIAPRPISDIVFLRCCRLALKHLTILATSRLYVAGHGEFFNKYIERTIEDGRQYLLPPQYNIIVDEGFLSGETNALITIPTSTGKTFLAELAIAKALSGGASIALYVAPYIALGRQVFDCLKSHAPDTLDVRGYFGSFNSHMEPINPFRKTVIVATPERMDAILRSVDLYRELGAVIFDEAHGLENGVRGARLEGLITRLKLRQASGDKFRIILLSAVLSNAGALLNWLGPHAEHYDHSWRPTARRLAMWFDSGNLAWLYGNDVLRPTTRRSVQAMGAKPLPWPAYMSPGSSFGAVRAQRPALVENVSFLARYAFDLLGGPILLACGTKALTRSIAQGLAAKLPERPYQPGSVTKILTEIEEKCPHLKALAKMLERGVAYHNASLPTSVRSLIEDALKVRDLNFVAATTTLAEGVDLPFRVTVVVDWLMGFGDSQAPMSSLLFRNISGRCGRAGEFVEGDTIIFDNMLGSLEYTGQTQRRRVAQARVFGDPPPLVSAIANDNYSDEVIDAIQSSVSSHFLASIPENRNDDDLAGSLAAASYARFSGASIDKMLLKIREQLLSEEEGEPFAKAASPMKLTALGQAANATGFGPRTCRSMLSYLKHADFSMAAPEAAAELLRLFGTCSEQDNLNLQSVASGRRSTFYFKGSDFEFVAEGWLSGRSLLEIFASLPKAISAGGAVTPSTWVSGAAASDQIEGQYDKFVDVTEYAFGSFLPWLLRALAAMTPVARPDEAGSRWEDLATLFSAARAADIAVIDTLLSHSEG